MPAYAGRQIIYETEVGIFQCVSRCVRQAFLCGQDAVHVGLAGLRRPLYTPPPLFKQPDGG